MLVPLLEELFPPPLLDWLAPPQPAYLSLDITSSSKLYTTKLPIRDRTIGEARNLKDGICDIDI